MHVLAKFGCRVLFISYVWGIGQAQTRAAASADWIEGPFEIRLNAKQYSQKLDVRVDQAVELRNPGTLTGGQIHLGLESLEVSGGQIWLRGLHLELRAAKWEYNESGLLEVQCRNPRLWADLPRIDIPVSSVQPEFVVRSEGSRYRLQGGASLRALIEATIKPVLTGPVLERALHFDGDCPSSVTHVLEAMLKARVANLPAKDPTTYKKLLDQAVSQIEGGLWVEASKLAFRWPFERETELHFKLLASPDSLTLKLVKPAEGAPLSSEARSLLERFAPEGPHVQAILSSGAMSGILAAALPSLSGRNGFQASEQGLYIEVPNQVSAQDFAPFVSELRSLPPATKIKLRLSFRDCRDGHPVAPRLKPWIGASGRDSGFDLEWNAILDLVDPASNRVLASRNVDQLKMVLSSQPGSSDWLYTSATRVNTGADQNCSIAALPVELQLTLDWVLNADGLKHFINEDLLSIFGRPEMQRLRRRMIGRARPETARADGGFWAEALVLEWPLTP